MCDKTKSPFSTHSHRNYDTTNEQMFVENFYKKLLPLYHHDPNLVFFYMELTESDDWSVFTDPLLSLVHFDIVLIAG